MSFVQVEHVMKSYGEVPVLKDISFSVEEGEFLTLLGPSGCGKSTLLRAIAGLNDIDSGKMFIGGRDITSLSPKDRQVGMVFQSYALFPNMSVFDNIAFGLKMGKMKKAEYTPLVEQMIEIIDLKGKENYYPNQLSGGQQQRVALGRSLVKRPKVLLLDEPLSALDAKIRRSLRNEIRQLQRKLNMTTIFVTHDQEEALTVSDRIIVMNNGEIEQQGTSEEIYTLPGTEFVARFIGSYNVWSRPEMEQAGFADIPSGDLFAIRPEVISIVPQAAVAAHDAGYMYTIGYMKHYAILGNVVRYHVDIGGLDASVDVLNDSGLLHLRENEAVRLAIPMEKCQPLKKLG
ncbi:ABC transporter ATP-binding protein [Paenibacillus darwinianus]|uniref:ABC transporter ATP-binding protein n=1 Tax=Paenibacillus darwinianus TaxID=1380763 RepID=A0A9W5RZF1_9BACL|nr:ABC transporter ATP-binding protein [Paenibacillus darwinianus]EXX84961.1 ABC transporter ATP-binding protein [Paenibacillus darwinianus]EXX84992.1 ABC transporter ATP-binding protein [Paenibacillus darwinianus]